MAAAQAKRTLPAKTHQRPFLGRRGASYGRCYSPTMLALSDSPLATAMTAAGGLPMEEVSRP
jgi:hypothetical protein